MEWYLPYTIIPGIGLLILSTSNIILQLNNEISLIKKEDNLEKHNQIIYQKLKQLRTLSWSISLQYIGVFLFLISGIVSALIDDNNTAKFTLILGVFLISFSLILLIVYSFRALHIRQKHLQL